MTEDDIVDVHGKIANCMRSIGLTGASLDHAIAGAFRSAVTAIESNRRADEQRAATLRLVD
ncbi:hypothetical protein [Pelagibacterium sp.]|uniref:hypothetical protein n=1 Tax=Pelagibacterium sp. TaxID=1967288 RepID=UPI003BAA6CDF